MNNNQFFLRAAHSQFRDSSLNRKHNETNNKNASIKASTMPRKQTKHETEKNKYINLWSAVLSDFDLIVVFNVFFLFLFSGRVCYKYFASFCGALIQIEFDKLLCCVFFFGSPPEIHRQSTSSESQRYKKPQLCCAYDEKRIMGTSKARNAIFD